MSDYLIPISFYSKDIIQTFQKQFPSSAFFLTNGGPHLAGKKAHMVYHSQNMQIIRVEKSKVVVSDIKFAERCRRCLLSAKG